MTTQNVPLSFDQHSADQACQFFGCSLPDLANIGLELAIKAGLRNSTDLAVLDPQANWTGTKTILEELDVRAILAEVQSSNNPSGPPTI